MKSCYMFCHSKSNTRVVLCIPFNDAIMRRGYKGRKNKNSDCNALCSVIKLAI